MASGLLVKRVELKGRVLVMRGRRGSGARDVSTFEDMGSSLSLQAKREE